MVVNTLYKGLRNSAFKLDPSCFTKVNYDPAGTNTTISAQTPNGVLAGSVAAVVPGKDLTVVPATNTTRAVGIFYSDVNGYPLTNAQAFGSGTLTVMMGPAQIEVDVYESTATYNVGDDLYASANGLLTTVPGTGAGALSVGYVYKAPSVAQPTLGVVLSV